MSSPATCFVCFPSFFLDLPSLIRLSWFSTYTVLMQHSYDDITPTTRASSPLLCAALSLSPVVTISVQEVTFKPCKWGACSLFLAAGPTLLWCVDVQTQKRTRLKTIAPPPDFTSLCLPFTLLTWLVQWSIPSVYWNPIHCAHMHVQAHSQAGSVGQ